jgi:partner of Y14 and mago
MPETKSGIITSESGERHIPASKRADGSTRREIKIRPGYKPPEDVEVYKNRAAESWKTRGSGGVPGAEGLRDDKADGTESKASSNKNAKRREARKKAKATSDLPPSQEPTPSSSTPTKSSDATLPPPDTPLDPLAEKEKQARNLRKKLRQAKELMDRKANGEILLPEQLEKVIKINELVRQLDSLGFDTNGQLKGDASRSAA